MACRGSLDRADVSQGVSVAKERALQQCHRASPRV